MRRAYLNQIEGPEHGKEKEEENRGDQRGAAAEHDEGDVDALMEWVQGLESEGNESDT